MFYYKIVAVKKGDTTTDTFYIRSIKELCDSEILWYLNNIQSNSCYGYYYSTLVDKDSIESGCILEDVVLGSKFYSIRYITKIGIILHLCISGTLFPSEETIMKYNAYLSKYKQIDEILSVEKVTAAKVAVEYNNTKEYIASDSIERMNDTKEVWTFPKMWLIPHEIINNGEYIV